MPREVVALAREEERMVNERLAACDWAADRGAKWRAQLDGMEATLAPVDEPLLRALGLGGPSRIADVGCGGGGTALAIVRRAAEGTTVHGVDVAPALVELARGRARGEQRGITFEVGDVATTAPETPYDLVVSRFGVMFFDDPPRAFDNLARWIAPGGRFAFAVWGRAQDNPWMATVRDVVAGIIPMPRPDPDAPGPFRYGDAAKLLDLLERAGLSDLEVRDWRGPLPIGGGLPPPEAARFALASFSSFGEQLAGAGGDALEVAQRRLTARFAHHQDAAGAVRIDACVHVVTGARR